jgi:hypothetical protein
VTVTVAGTIALKVITALADTVQSTIFDFSSPTGYTAVRIA